MVTHEFHFIQYEKEYQVQVHVLEFDVLDVRHDNKIISETYTNGITGRDELELDRELWTILTVGEENGLQRAISIEGDFQAIKGNRVALVCVSGDCFKSAKHN